MCTEFDECTFVRIAQLLQRYFFLKYESRKIRVSFASVTKNFDIISILIGPGNGKQTGVYSLTTKQTRYPVVDVFPDHFDLCCLVGFFYRLSSD